MACQVRIYLKIDASQPVMVCSRGRRQLKIGIPTIGAKLPQLTLPGVNALLILGSISQLARGCHQQRVEERSVCPQALIAVCPTVFKSAAACLKPFARIFKAALWSRSNTVPQLQIWILTESDFLTLLPQVEQSWEVYSGLTATTVLPYTFPKYGNHWANCDQAASLIDLASLWFFTIFLTWRSS